MRVGIHASRLTFANGRELNLTPGSIVVFTGPNNSGKSTVLQEIYRHFDRIHRIDSLKGLILSDLEKSMSGTADEFISYFEAEGYLDEKLNKFQFSTGYGGGSYLEKTLRKQHADGEFTEAVVSEFALRMNASARLSSENYNERGVEKAAAILFDDEALEIRVSKAFREAFGTDLILNRSPTKLTFHVGERSELAPHSQRNTKEFRKWIDSLPKVNSQGDGIRAYTRILLQLMVLGRSVLLIDEPELFLHPPQVRQLARTISANRQPNSQVFIATHSDDFVKGLLDADHARTNFVRLERRAGKANVSVLESKTLETFWSDPLLRTTNALSCLFYDVSVLCEGETDVRFFQSLFDAHRKRSRATDFFFLSCGGKSKISKISEALHAINVPHVVLADFDMLSDSDSMQRLLSCKSEGQALKKLNSGCKRIKNEVETLRNLTDGHYFKGEIERIMREYKPDGPVSSDIVSQIKAMTTNSSPWQRTKFVGVDVFHNSSTRNFSLKFLKELESVGVFIHRQGALEALSKTSGTGRKSQWLEAVLRRNLEVDEELEPAREIMRKVIKYSDDLLGEPH